MRLYGAENGGISLLAGAVLLPVRGSWVCFGLVGRFFLVGGIVGRWGLRMRGRETWSNRKESHAWRILQNSRRTRRLRPAHGRAHARKSQTENLTNPKHLTTQNDAQPTTIPERETGALRCLSPCAVNGCVVPCLGVGGTIQCERPMDDAIYGSSATHRCFISTRIRLYLGESSTVLPCPKWLTKNSNSQR